MLTDQVCGVSRLLEVLRQESDGGVEAVWLEPLYGSPLHAQPPGVETGQQSRPAGGTLGADVGLGQLHSSPGQALGGRRGLRGVGQLGRPHLQVGGEEELIVPGHLVPSQIISQEEDNVRPGLRTAPSWGERRGVITSLLCSPTPPVNINTTNTNSISLKDFTAAQFTTNCSREFLSTLHQPSELER